MTNQHIARNRSAIAIVGLIALLCAACGTVTVISSYDEATDQGVTALHRSVSGLLDQLDQPSVPDYAANKKTYDSVRSDLAALRLRNDLRPKNSLAVKQLALLADQLGTLEGQHKAGTLNQPMIQPARDALDQTFRAILKLELEKKALDKTE